MRIRASNAWEDKIEAVKSILRNYRFLVTKYNACLAMYETLYPSSTTTLKEVVSFAKGENAGETKVINILDHRARLFADLHKQIEYITNIENKVNELPPDESTIIRLYYLTSPATCMVEICKKMYISKPTAWRMITKGLNSLSEKMILNDIEMRF